MPTYAYACTQCEHRFEVRQSFSDSSLRECPECTGPLRKLFDSVGIVFKGSGFYRTDSRSAPASGDSSSPGGGGKASGDGSSDKPAAASTPAASTGSGPAKAGSAKAGSAAGSGSAA